MVDCVAQLVLMIAVGVISAVLGQLLIAGIVGFQPGL